MADETSKRKDGDIRFRQPTMDDGEVTGHKWEPHTPEHDELLARPTPPAKPSGTPSS